MSRHPTACGRCNRMTRRSTSVGVSGPIFVRLKSSLSLRKRRQARRTPYNELLNSLSFIKLTHFQERPQYSLTLKPDQQSELAFSGHLCCPLTFPLCSNE